MGDGAAISEVNTNLLSPKKIVQSELNSCDLPIPMFKWHLKITPLNESLVFKYAQIHIIINIRNLPLSLYTWYVMSRFQG